jgi:hypothetical protein
MLGKTVSDGTTKANPVSHLVEHLNRALEKPAADERLIFIDLNADGEIVDGKPLWLNQAVECIEQYELNDLASGMQAYVFVTNVSFHRSLGTVASRAIAPFGLGIPDFNRPGTYRLSEVYRRKQKHIDAFDIAESLAQYPHLPDTFDGSLPSETLHGFRSRVVIGQTYFLKASATAALSAPSPPQP